MLPRHGLRAQAMIPFTLSLDDCRIQRCGARRAQYFLNQFARLRTLEKHCPEAALQFNLTNADHGHGADTYEAQSSLPMSRVPGRPQGRASKSNSSLHGDRNVF
jgi:hypothetical protein